MNTRTRLGRLAPPLALLAGLAYAVEGAIVVRAPQSDHHWHASGYTVEAAFVIALLATIPLLPLLHTPTSKLGHAAARISQLGFAAMLLSAVTSLAAGGTTLGPAFLVGVLAALAGLLTLSVPAIRARRGTWWSAPLAFAGPILSIALGDHGGGILLGLAWISISIALRERTEQPLPAAARAISLDPPFFWRMLGDWMLVDLEASEGWRLAGLSVGAVSVVGVSEADAAGEGRL